MSLFTDLYTTLKQQPGDDQIGGNVPLSVAAGQGSGSSAGGAGIMQQPASAAGSSFSSQYMPKIGGFTSGSGFSMPRPQAPAMPQMNAPPQPSNLGFRPTPTPPPTMAQPQNIVPQNLGPQVPGAPVTPIPQGAPLMAQQAISNPYQQRGLLQQ
jgi:hypothetical protein